MSRGTTTADHSPVERLFEHSGEALWRFGLRMEGNPETARDLVQETFLRALRSRLPANEKAAQAWLYRTLTNCARDLYRRRRVRRSNPNKAQAAVAIGNPVDPDTRVLARERFARAMQELTPRRRAILLLHEFDGLTTAAIARTLGLRKATVRWHLAQAKRDLRKSLD